MSRLTVMYPTRQRGPDGNVFYVCRCRCGNVVSITRPNRVNSCGCLRTDSLRELGVNKGEENGQAVLTADDVKEIKLRRSQGLLHREIAAEFNVARQTVSSILQGRNWHHVV